MIMILRVIVQVGQCNDTIANIINLNCIRAMLTGNRVLYVQETVFVRF